ncbi:MAG TPA: protein-export chaperone SecB [Candidatus Izemoplasmatales bacterium]|nr:protein-export chaperone SecB [Candidatus Izemoplasmatales bacterium]
MEHDVLKLNHYSVEKIDFHLNKNFNPKATPTISLNPDFRRNIRKIDENKALVELTVIIQTKEVQLPFYLEVTIGGLFTLEHWEESENTLNLMKNQTIAILFPLIRSLVTVVTANSNIPPLMLPLLDVAALFEESEKRKKFDIHVQ